MREVATADACDGCLQFVIAVVVVPWIVTAALEIHDFLCRQAEQEEVLCADFLANFDIGAVQGADRQGTVHGELHIAGSRGFLAGSGDLLGQVRDRVDAVTPFDAEVGNEYHLEPAPDIGIIVDHVTHRVDQLDDQLGREVTGCCLATEDKGAWHYVAIRVLFDTVVQGDDMQNHKVLPLVLVQTFYLHITQRFRVQFYPRVLLVIGSLIALVVQLDLAPAGNKIRVVHKGFEFPQLVQVGYPAVTDLFADKRRQARVAQHHPAPRGHPVGLVAEPLGEELIEILQCMGLE